MTKRNTPRSHEWQCEDRCRACQVTIQLTFPRPEYGRGSTLLFNCPQCKSSFRYSFARKRMVDVNGVELPLTITVKVIEITDEGLAKYQAWKRGELKPGGLIDNQQPVEGEKILPVDTKEGADVSSGANEGGQ